MGIRTLDDFIMKPDEWPWGYATAKFKPLSPYALSFDGSNDYVGIPSSYDLLLKDRTGKTIELWVKYKNLSSTNACILDLTDCYFIEHNKNYPLRYRMGQNGTRYSLDSFYNDYEWHHFALVWDNGNVGMYVDGQLEGPFQDDGSSSQVSSSDLLCLGGWYVGYTPAYEGQMQDLRIWNTARTQQEIQDNMDRQLFGNEPGLVAYYPMTEGSGTILTDATGNDNDGTIYGATWVER